MASLHLSSPSSSCFSSLVFPSSNQISSSVCVHSRPCIKRKPRFSSCWSNKTLFCRAAAGVVFRNLDADDFRHPLDKQNTLILRAIPGLNDIGKAILGTVSEQVMLLENIGTSVLVSENQLSDLHKLMVEAADILNIESPMILVNVSSSHRLVAQSIS